MQRLSTAHVKVLVKAIHCLKIARKFSTPAATFLQRKPPICGSQIVEDARVLRLKLRHGFEDLNSFLKASQSHQLDAAFHARVVADGEFLILLIQFVGEVADLAVQPEAEFTSSGFQIAAGSVGRAEEVVS